jgi:hypothetical protein
VIDQTGVMLEHLLLPDYSGILKIDNNGYIYTREQERTMLMKYKLRKIDNGD